LKGLRGPFILALNDLPEGRQIFAGFHTKAVDTHYALAGQGAQAAREVIVSPRVEQMRTSW